MSIDVSNSDTQDKTVVIRGATYRYSVHDVVSYEHSRPIGIYIIRNPNGSVFWYPLMLALGQEPDTENFSTLFKVGRDAYCHGRIFDITDAEKMEQYMYDCFPKSDIFFESFMERVK